ncbi:MAG: hypothetical protein ACI9T7_000927 [Oleiphilaceae bacterium]|jgi:hypothetical protein
MSKSMKYSELMLRKHLFKLYEKRLVEELGLKPETIEGYSTDISPIVYLSILNKKVSKIPKKIYECSDFIVPEEHLENWAKLKRAIENGDDISSYTGKGTENWIKADFLLFSCNVYHLHITSRKGKASNKELVFGVFKKDKFYALYFGDHNDLFSAKMFVDIANKHWPNEIFNPVEKNGSNFYTPKLASDPSSHFNLINPAGSLNGHQHSNLITMKDESGDIRNVPQHLLFQYNNEVNYLNNIENKLAGRIRADVNMSLTVDFEQRLYIIKVKGHYTPYIYPFLESGTCSGTFSEKYL